MNEVISEVQDVADLAYRSFSRFLGPSPAPVAGEEVTTEIEAAILRDSVPSDHKRADLLDTVRESIIGTDEGSFF